VALFREPSIRVLIDEAHQQAWTIRPDVAARLQPTHPGDSSYARAAEVLRARDFTVEALTEGILDPEVLATVDVLVLPHPSEAEYEATTGVGSPVYTPGEIAAIAEFVRSGGGLVILAESEQAKYGNNLAAVCAEFGITLGHASIQDYSAHHQAPSWVHVKPTSRVQHPLLVGVDEAVVYRSGTLEVDSAAGDVVLSSMPTASPAHAGVLGAVSFGRGRVVAFADSDLFGDDCIESFDHVQLWLNSIYYVALPSFVAESVRPPSASRTQPAWRELKDATAVLRLLQQGDGSVDIEQVDADRVAGLVRRMADAVEQLMPTFEHDRDYLAQVVLDLMRWSDEGFGKPDFGPSLSLFHPELSRIDGIEHLVLFPMYTPNGSLETRFEALIVRVPWPSWIRALEHEEFDNAKFVPVHLVDHTDGYDSECAVLFPETVSVTGSAANYFGGIFCDREAERYQRVVGAAVATTGLQLAPDIAGLIASQPMTQDMFELWDLIHDRAHSHGELPFDPFMIRKRLPFWMYSLEELRCDLTAFSQSVKLAPEFPFARYVQFGVLFDRLFRFPITGGRVRNYDGLAGQLLFGFLHSQGVLTWRDNTLEIDWDRLPDAVEDLRVEIEQLYRNGISSSKVRYWIAAHDLVARYVQPNLASQWTPQRREGRDEVDHKAWVDLVHPDEFPLSMFYQSLAQNLSTVLEGRVAA
jgi:Family of unknown function (DUF6421)